MADERRAEPEEEWPKRREKDREEEGENSDAHLENRVEAERLRHPVGKPREQVASQAEAGHEAVITVLTASVVEPKMRVRWRLQTIW